MSKKQTRLFHPDLEIKNNCLWFLLEIERLEPRVIVDLKQLVSDWIEDKKLKANSKTQKHINRILKDYEAKFVGVSTFDIQKLCQSFLVRIVLNNSFEWDTDSKKILSDIGILDKVDQWLEKWNLNGKEWIYGNLVNTFSRWGDPDSVSPFTFGGVISDDNEVVGISKPEPFEIRRWSVERNESAEQYMKQMELEFHNHLRAYLQDSYKTLKSKGYKEKRRPFDFDQTEWVVRWTVQEWTIADIANAYNVTESAVRKALKKFEIYDLPIRKVEKIKPKKS